MLEFGGYVKVFCGSAASQEAGKVGFARLLGRTVDGPSAVAAGPPDGKCGNVRLVTATQECALNDFRPMDLT